MGIDGLQVKVATNPSADPCRPRAADHPTYPVIRGRAPRSMSVLAFASLMMQIVPLSSSSIGGKLLRRLALAVLATLAIGASACSATSTATANPPAVTKFKPTSGPVGTTVVIKGTNLTGATRVAFNGVAATIIKDFARNIRVKVPVGATTGKIEIVTPKGQVQTATVFKVT